ncbi:hypothetical protein A1OO_20460 [Enterovibrio norvegicus FF-33]|uniref:hypothetical protein n=1 Tax=Enterovibrio norvegicus TaxID=188144 RepID=UPI0002E671B1|nr:hypothetical protein [Enterovibrio norvegicus]OEE68103.1 hypothetical protein A1OO_20460 [Enterovibrio norvegicus FF-33]
MSDWKRVSLIFIAGLIMSLGLIMNPGYFSHDEISWGIKATSGNSLSDISFYNIFHYNEFHYRPLNFNSWLITSYYLYELPQLYHFLIVLFGLTNTVLVYFFLKREVDSKLAVLTAVISTIMPTIAFVNGWIGTMADVFWFMCCIVSLMIHQTNRRLDSLNFPLIALSLLFFILALMFKETAVVYPGVLFIYVVYATYKERSDFRIFINKSDIIIFLLSTIIFLFYITIRFKFLFPSDGGGYGAAFSNIPIRMLEYFIYPFLINNVELHGLFLQHSLSELITAFCIHFLLVLMLCKQDKLKYFLYFGCYFVTAVPILILDMSLPHYIYASGFVTAFGISFLFFENKRKRFASMIFFVLLAMHGIKVQVNYVSTGSYQNNFVGTLYSVIKGGNKKCSYVIKPEAGSTSWVAVRAIAFRGYIDDVKIDNNVYFEGELDSELVERPKCNLSLDTKGRVFLIEGNDGEY